MTGTWTLKRYDEEDNEIELEVEFEIYKATGSPGVNYELDYQLPPDGKDLDGHEYERLYDYALDLLAQSEGY